MSQTSLSIIAEGRVFFNTTVTITLKKLSKTYGIRIVSFQAP